MLHATNLSFQHQIPCFDDSFAVEKEYESDAHFSESIAVGDSMKLSPLFEQDKGVSAADMKFLFDAIQSFDSGCNDDANSCGILLPSNCFSTLLPKESINRDMPTDQRRCISPDDSLRSFKMSGNSSSVEASQDKTWKLSDTEEDHTLISDEGSPDVQIANYTVLKDLVMKPSKEISSENELPELNLEGCLCVSEPTEFESLLSVFEESAYDYKNSSDSLDQSLSSNNQSSSNEESRHKSIPSALKKPINCDTSVISPDIKPYQEKNWFNRYKQLQQFHKENGHCCVPNNCSKYRQLANWVKRQRREYKHMKNGRKSAMTTERVYLLDNIDFIWDSHDIIWRERLEALKSFRQQFGNCNVPYRYNEDKQLGTWVKAQRHQYSLYRQGKASSMNPRRIFLLNNLDFEWVGRSFTSKRL